MFITEETRAWSDLFEATGQDCRVVLASIFTNQDEPGGSLRDAGLLCAQIVITDVLSTTLTLAPDIRSVKTSIIKTCHGLLDQRNNTFTQLSTALGNYKLIDHIPVGYVRRLLSIGSGLPHRDNDQYLSPFFEKLGQILIPTELVVSSTSSPAYQGRLDLDHSVSVPSKISTRKSRGRSLKRQENVG